MKKNKFYVTPSMEVMKLNLTSTVLTISVKARQLEQDTWDDFDENRE